jgi:hypothetical protein
VASLLIVHLPYDQAEGILADLKDARRFAAKDGAEAADRV